MTKVKISEIRIEVEYLITQGKVAQANALWTQAVKQLYAGTVVDDAAGNASGDLVEFIG